MLRIGSLKSHQKTLQPLAEFLVVAVYTIVFVLLVVNICTFVLVGGRFQGHDFVSFWSAGKQLVHHVNPYDESAILHIERSVGYPFTSEALVMRNPPSALLIVLPFGLIGLRVGAFLWSALLIGCLVLSVQMLQVLYRFPKNHLSLLAYSFGPTLACLLYSQTGIIALLGLVLFLRFHRSHQFVSGLALWLCALKPICFCLLEPPCSCGS
jgi:hypothetical protein